MTIVRVGSNLKFSTGWDAAFGKKQGKGQSPAAKKTSSKKPGKKSKK